MEQELKDLDDGLRQTLRQSPAWRENDELLRYVPSITAADLAGGARGGITPFPLGATPASRPTQDDIRPLGFRSC